MRARMLQDAALASTAADIQGAAAEVRPVRPPCGVRLESRGTVVRERITQHNQTVRLTRSYGVCPQYGAGLFPLDEELALLPGALTPNLHEDLVRLGGRGCRLAGQTAEVTRIEQALPVPPTGPAQQFLSVDGAMVPLVGGEWAEVKTLVIGEVQPAVIEQGERVVHTRQHSYFSRLSEAEVFQRQALLETQRRGVETAAAVAAVTDGAEWIQKFVDQHRHDAVRILDFPHAAEHLNAVAQAVFGEGTPPVQAWLAAQLHGLKHDGPSVILAAVRTLVSQQPEQTELASQLAYLEKRAAPANALIAWLTARAPGG